MGYIMQFVSVVVVCDVAMHGQVAGHRGWVLLQEGDVPLSPKVDAFDTFWFTAINIQRSLT